MVDGSYRTSSPPTTIRADSSLFRTTIMILGKVVTLWKVNRGRGRQEGDITFSRRLNTAHFMSA